MKESESESHSVVFDSLQHHTVRGVLQARILEWVAFPFTRDQTQVSLIAGGFSISSATREALFHKVYLSKGFPGGSAVKSLPAMQEARELCSSCAVQSLGWEDPLEEGVATHSSILA